MPDNQASVIKSVRMWITSGLQFHTSVLMVATDVYVFSCECSTFRQALEQYADCPERVGECFIQHVGLCYLCVLQCVVCIDVQCKVV